MRKELKIFAVLILVIIIIIEFIILPYLDNEEILFISDPVQEQLSTGINKQIIHDGKKHTVNIDILAQYQILAVVKKKKYYSFDPASEVSPMDLVLVWGNLDTKEIDDNISYSQSGRWYYYRYDCTSCVDGNYISNHSANVHIIPKDNKVLRKLKQLNKEDYITLKGYLVNVNFSDGDWMSSLSRTDTGNGACEIMYVESVAINY